MAIITLKTIINAPIEKCFDIARSIDLHVHSMQSSNEKAVGGIKSGLINLNESVTWKARHFGFNFTMKSKITAMEKPHYFIDEMISGPFKKLYHQHIFKATGSKTEMTDVFEFEAPFGFLGTIAEKLVLRKYMLNLLTQRNLVIEKQAEYL